jgi:hypothetical protein
MIEFVGISKFGTQKQFVRLLVRGRQRTMEPNICRFLQDPKCRIQKVQSHFKQLETHKSGPHLTWSIHNQAGSPAQSPRWRPRRSPPHRSGPSIRLVPGWGRWRRRSPPPPSCSSAWSPRHSKGTLAAINGFIRGSAMQKKPHKLS